MIEPALLIPIIAVVISVGTFIFNIMFSIFGYKQKAESSYVETLEGRIKLLEADNADLKTRMKACEDARTELTKENVNLLKRIIEEGVISKLQKENKGV